MPLLFSYGTLQQPDVQLATFGRLLDGHRDGLDESRVSGTVYQVTDAELAAADEFERQFACARTAVVLTSTKTAWVYVHGPAPIA